MKRTRCRPGFPMFTGSLVTAVTDLKMADGGQGLLLPRKLEKGRRQVLECRTPALLTVDPSLNRLRESSLPSLLRALEAAVETVEIELGSILGLLPEEVFSGNAGGLQPLNPAPLPIYTPDSSLPARARIEQMLSGGWLKKKACWLKVRRVLWWKRSSVFS